LRKIAFNPHSVFPVAVLLGVASLMASGCGRGSLDPSTARGKRAILDEAALLLSEERCEEAIELIKPVYNSLYTDNDIRMMMASTYGCSANLNFFSLIGEVGTQSATIIAGGLWSFMAEQFPSTDADRVPEAGQLAQDALQAVISPSAVVLSNGLFNTDTFNPGAYSVDDRLLNATAYLFFTSMATMGGLENRNGNPLPWTDPTLVDEDGCAYASAVVNFADSLTGLETVTQGQLKTAISGMKSAFQTLIYANCDYGCTTICGIAGGCPTCPKELRNRTSCTSVATDPASCAAAGIIANPGFGVNDQWGLFP
jgi:hypothetical protein